MTCTSKADAKEPLNQKRTFQLFPGNLKESQLLGHLIENGNGSNTSMNEDIFHEYNGVIHQVLQARKTCSRTITGYNFVVSV